jgi:predicted dehydrogenase
MPAIETVTKLAVIGAGRMGVRHMQAARSLGLEVSGIYDVNQQSALQAATSIGLSASVVFRSAEDLFKQSGARALAVATTADSHRDYVLAAAGAGFSHILCEKPMAVSVNQCQEMIIKCRETGTRLAVNHQTRLTNSFMVLKELMTSQPFGGFASLTTSAGNVGLAMGVSHFVELFRLMADSPIRQVRFISDAQNEVNPRGSCFSDPAGRVYAFSDGGHRMHMEFGSDQGHGLTSVFTGRYGQVTLDNLTGAASFTHRLPTERSLPLTQYGSDALNGSFHFPVENAMTTTARVWVAFLNDSDYPTGDDGAYVVSVLAAAQQSALIGGGPVSPLIDVEAQHEYRWA